VTLLTARGIARRFGSRVALEPTDVSLAGGEVVALVGPNGAGKSTLLAILAGSLEPSEGTVERPERVAGVRARGALRRLTALENLRLFAALEGVPGRADELAAESELPPERTCRVARWATGNGSTSALPACLAAGAAPRRADLVPRPAQRERVWRIARDVAEGGGAVLVATHHWEELRWPRRPDARAGRGAT
jgi:ABC-type multidrug transport system ATPase subunit